MSSLNLLIATMQADGRLPKSPCAKIEKLKKTEKATREKRIKVEKSAKKQRSKAIEKLTAKVKREVHEIDDTYGKPGRPLKCSTPKPKTAAKRAATKAATKPVRASRKDEVLEQIEWDAALKRGTSAEVREHGHGRKDARQIAADHLAEDPHYYDKSKPAQRSAKQPTARAAKARTKMAIAAKAARSGQKEVAAFEEKVISATKSDVAKAKAQIKREVAAAEKRAVKAEAAAAKENRRQDRANLAAKKKAAKKQAKAGAYRPQVAPESPKAEKPPKAPRQKRSPRIDLPPPQSRSEVFVADTAATDAAKTERAMQGFDDIVARQIARMRAANGPTVESMPRRRAMY